MLVEARYRVSAFEYDKAVAIYEQLLRWYPDNVDLGVKLVEAQMSAGDVQGMAETTRRLRTLPPPMGSDARLDHFEGMAIAFSGDARAARETFDRGLANARAIGSRTLEAQLLQWRGWLSWVDGQMADAIANSEEAIRIFEETGNHNGTGISLMVIALVSLEKGEMAKALEWGERLHALGREVGNSDFEGSGDLTTGWVLVQADRLAEARKREERSLEIFRRICLHYCAGISEMGLAEVAHEEGKYGESEAHARAAIAIFRQYHMALFEAPSQMWLARALLAQGRRTEAAETMKDANRLFQGLAVANFVISAQITDALISAEAGPAETSAAITRLGEIIARADAGGFVRSSLEARLEQARLMLRAGRGKEMGAMLAGVERDARARGLKLIARRARGR